MFKINDCTTAALEDMLIKQSTRLSQAHTEYARSVSELRKLEMLKDRVWYQNYPPKMKNQTESDRQAEAELSLLYQEHVDLTIKAMIEKNKKEAELKSEENRFESIKTILIKRSTKTGP